MHLATIKEFLFANKTLKQTIAKNTFWLFFGQILNRLLKAALVIWAARVLGAQGYGAFSFALSFILLAMIFSDIGIGAIIIREISRTGDENQRKRYLANSFYLKAVLVVICAGLVAAASAVLPGQETALLLWLLLGLLVFSSARDYFLAVTRSLEKMEIEAANTVIEAAATVILGFIFLKMAVAPASLAMAYDLGTLAGLIYLVIVLRGRLGSVVGRFEPPLAKKILSWAWPFAIVGVISSILNYTDVLMLGWLKPIETVGWYAAASKIPDLLIIPASLVNTAVLPSLSRLTEAREKFSRLVRQSIGFLLTLAFPLTAGGIILARPVILLLFGGQYLPSVPGFKILLLLILINCGWLILGSALFVKNFQKKTMIFSAAAAGLNVALNLALIPRYSLNGAAAASVAAQFAGFIFAFFLFKKIGGVFPVGVSEIAKPLLATLAMVLFLMIPAVGNSAIWVSIPLAGIVYFVFLFLLRAPAIKEGIYLYKNYSSHEA